jgi:hypothetical protein
VELSSIALQGLERAHATFEQSAARLASVASPTPDGVPVDVADLSTAAVDLLNARQDFSLNLKVVKTTNEMS